ncbi:N(4)-(Beta-N-acetylglucosaminyl)-L-asparaginase isoform X2 [Stegostoma tigrinum]|uniref:N(4)-(Beta-N-acetylglucosaminyl)-L-asparaginase isoform X2 n=1 Tax=Stegostoma tigrinum TaxID=3053191 RepID=UPI002870AF6D|nr:N(4)-(Beta-N-acetylglucosaminyl)-L-asparaginase isoform X2 [Stegostoma tigrinum]
MAAAVVGTWAFSLAAVDKARLLLATGRGASATVQEAMAEVENDKETGCFVVGRGGFPNKAGVVQCDAAIMEGLPGRFGAVAALPGIGIPLTVARMVMDKSDHSMLVGGGAVAFAKEQGFSIEDNSDMMTEAGLAAYEEFLRSRKSPSKNHDTLGLIVLDQEGNITVGVSTSGAPFKDPGRVGDSPLPGCGLYADSRARAAAASGDGDKIMCFCPSFHVVQLMKQGLSPTDACQSVVQDICNRVGKKDIFEIGLIALNMKGEVGAASTVPFPYTFWAHGMETVEQRQSCPQIYPVWFDARSKASCWNCQVNLDLKVLDLTMLRYMMFVHV